jgi:hypothetical protein
MSLPAPSDMGGAYQSDAPSHIVGPMLVQERQWDSSSCPWYCTILALLAAFGVCFGLAHMRNVQVSRKEELKAAERVLIEGKHEEFAQYAPLKARIMALAACTALFLFYLAYIWRRRRRQEEIRSQYWKRYFWIFTICFGTFAYLLMTPIQYNLPHLGRASWADKRSTPTWSKVTLLKWFQHDREKRAEEKAPDKVIWFFYGS